MYTSIVNDYIVLLKCSFNKLTTNIVLVSSNRLHKAEAVVCSNL